MARCFRMLAQHNRVKAGQLKTDNPEGFTKNLLISTLASDWGVWASPLAWTESIPIEPDTVSTVVGNSDFLPLQHLLTLLLYP